MSEVEDKNGKRLQTHSEVETQAPSSSMGSNMTLRDDADASLHLLDDEVALSTKSSCCLLNYATCNLCGKRVSVPRWALCGGGCVGAVALLGFVVVPAVVQHIVNSTSVSIVSAAISNPSETGFQFASTLSLSLNGGPTAMIKGFPVEMRVVDEDGNASKNAFGKLELPDQNLDQDVNSVSVNAAVEIVDKDEMQKFTEGLVFGKKMTVGMKGNASVQKFSWLPSLSVSFEKNVEMVGLNGLDGDIEMKDFVCPGDAKDGGVNIVANGGIRNPTNYTLDMGERMTAAVLMVDDEAYMGTVQTFNLTVTPGGNDVQFTGFINPSPMTVNDTEAFFSNYMQGIDQEVLVAGTDVCFELAEDGITCNRRVSWMTSVIQKLKTKAPFPGYNGPNFVEGIEINSILMNVVDDDHVYMESANMAAKMRMPFAQFKHSVSQAELNVDLGGNARVHVPMHTVGFVPDPDDITVGTLICSIDEQLPVEVYDRAKFSEMVTKFVTEDITTVTMSGNGTALIDSALGQGVKLSGIPLQADVKIQGFNGFKSKGQIDVIHVDVGSANETSVEMIASLQFNTTNSPLGMMIPILPMHMAVFDVELGVCYTENVYIKPNAISVLKRSLVVKRTPENAANLDDAISKTLTNFASYTETMAHAWGAPELLPDNLSIVKEALKNFHTEAATILPYTENIIRWGQLSLFPTFNDQHRITLPATLYVHNPFSVALNMTAVVAPVYTGKSHNYNVEFADFDEHFDADRPYIVPANRTTPSVELHPIVNLKECAHGFVSFEECAEAVIGSFVESYVASEIQVTAFVGDGFPVQLTAVEKDIPVSLHPPSAKNKLSTNEKLVLRKKEHAQNQDGKKLPSMKNRGGVSSILESSSDHVTENIIYI